VPGLYRDHVDFQCHNILGNTPMDANNRMFVTVEASLTFAWQVAELYDDDFDPAFCPPQLYDDLLPQWPDLSIAQQAYRKAYIEVDDGGGDWNSAWEGKPYLSLVEPSPTNPCPPLINHSDRGMNDKGNNSFWVGFILNGFQYTQGISADPDRASVSGITDVRLAPDLRTVIDVTGCAVFLETHRDRDASLGISSPLGMSVAHELAHSVSINSDHAVAKNYIKDWSGNPLPLKQFKVNGTLNVFGLNVVDGSSVFITDPTQQPEFRMLARGKLQSYQNGENECTIVLQGDGMEFDPQAPRQYYQANDKAEVWSLSVMGQFEDVADFCPLWLDHLRDNTYSPLP
jgi:hypothetical protein